jgi:hypothetical protein
MRDDIVWQFRQRQRDRENGVKHTPLHTLQECCEAAGIDHRAFGRYAAKYPDAPKPVLQHEKTRWKAGKKYYRKHEFVQWVNQVRQQKEKAMPDIKTALQQALAKTANTWAADDEAHQKIEPVKTETPKEIDMPKQYFQATNNVTRATFDYVYQNPGKLRKEVLNALQDQGFKRSSTTSLIGQFVKSGAFVERGTHRLLFATSSQYTPLKTARRKKVANVDKAVAKPEAAPAQRKYVEITSKRTGEVINPRKEEWTVDSVIGNLNVRQAMAVYAELRGIFGA